MLAQKVWVAGARQEYEEVGPGSDGEAVTGVGPVVERPLACD